MSVCQTYLLKDNANFSLDSTEPKHEILIAFSVYTNSMKIMACSRAKSSNEISCLHGLRSLSMFWVLTSHLYDQHFFMPMANGNYIFEVFFF